MREDRESLVLSSHDLDELISAVSMRATRMDAAATVTYDPEERERLLLRAATARTVEGVCRRLRTSPAVTVNKVSLLNTVISRVGGYMDSQFPGTQPDLMHDGEPREAQMTLYLLEEEVAWLERRLGLAEGTERNYW